MDIVSEDKSSILTLQVLEKEPAYYPSVQLYASIADNGFCGENSGWVGTKELRVFLMQLQQCEQTRQGRASLIVNSELELTIERVDGWGHFLLSYKLSRTRFTKRSITAQSVTGEFDLDGGLFAQMVAEFDDLLPME